MWELIEIGRYCRFQSGTAINIISKMLILLIYLDSFGHICIKYNAFQMKLTKINIDARVKIQKPS